MFNSKDLQSIFIIKDTRMINLIIFEFPLQTTATAGRILLLEGFYFLSILKEQRRSTLEVSLVKCMSDINDEQFVIHDTNKFTAGNYYTRKEAGRHWHRCHTIYVMVCVREMLFDSII